MLELGLLVLQRGLLALQRGHELGVELALVVGVGTHRAQQAAAQGAAQASTAGRRNGRRSALKQLDGASRGCDLILGGHRR